MALVFFEHGKRVAAKLEQPVQPNSLFERAEHGLVGLELVETQGIWKKEDVEDEITLPHEETFIEPSTPLLYKKQPEMNAVVELDGGVRGAGVAENKAKMGAVVESEEETRKRVLSVRSIYELG